MLVTIQSFQLIALLVRYHRKKFPKKDVPEGSSKEVSKFLYMIKHLIFGFKIYATVYIFSRVLGKTEVQNSLYNYADILCSAAISSCEFSVQGIYRFS